MTRTRHEHSRFGGSGAVLAFLFAAFVCVRVLTAWVMRYEVHGDLAIVQMMVRDMLGGQPVPAFFSGQAYMGSLEPATSALLCRVTGHGDFSLTDGNVAVCASLGTVLFMCLAALFAWGVAWRIGGNWAGIAAMAFLAIGPMPFVHYSVSQRGGYGVLLFTVAALLSTGGSLVADELNKKRVGFAKPFFAGLVLGIGFWCNQLVFPAALAAGVGLALFAPTIFLRFRLWIGGVAGFAIGSSPFWFWNVQNGWESFLMAGGIVLDPAVMARNIFTLVSKRVPMLLGADPAHAPLAIRVTVTGAAVLAMLISLLAFTPPPRRIDVPFREMPREAKAQLTICWLFIAFFAVCFASSHFAIFETPRYLLATLPAVAAIIGVACAAPRFKSARIASVLCLALLVAWQARQYPLIVGRGRKDAQQASRYTEASETLRTNSVKAAYCSFRHNTINLCTDSPDHKPVFTDFILERRPDFRQLAEIDNSPAVVDDSLGLSRWITASGGGATFESPCGIRLAYNVRPPSQDLAEIAEEEWADDKGALRKIADRSIATSLELPGKTASVTVSFRSPQVISCVRALVSGIDGKASCRIEGREAPDAPFRRLSHDVPYVRAIWSGPRFYPVHGDAPLDIHFPSQTVEAVRVVFSFARPGGAVRKLHELQLLSPIQTPSGTAPDWQEAAQGLLAKLRIQSIERLYATRWVANWIDVMTNGGIETNCGEDLHPKKTGCPRPPKLPAPVRLDRTTALLASPSGAASLREVLATSMIAMREIPIPGLGTLFIPETIQRVPLDEPSGILFDADLSVLQPTPTWMESRIRILEGETVTNERSAKELTRVLSTFPESFTAINYAIQNASTDDNAQAYARTLKRLTSPAFPRDAVFGGEFTWLGTDVAGREAGLFLKPGAVVRLRHFWSTGSAPGNGRLRVFTHFVADNGYRFQDDFDFALPPEGPDIMDAFGEQGEWWWHNDRNVVIPADAPEGEYEMRIGLYDAVYSSRRLGVKATYTRTRRGAAIVKDIFEVVRHPAERENAK